MAKKMYIGIGGVAKKVKKMYIGIGGVAKKVKKGYIGIGGIARLFFGSRELVKYTSKTITLSAARRHMVNTSFNNKTYFLAGDNSSGLSSVVDGFDSSLTRTTGAIGVAIEAGGASSTSVYMYHGGGLNSSNKTITTVYAWDTSLTRSTCSSGLPTSCMNMGTARLNDYSIFAGGWSQPGSNDQSITNVTRYNNNKSRTNASSGLNYAREQLGAGQIGNYALFGGGLDFDNGGTAIVDTYTYSLTHSTTSNGLSWSGYVAGAVSTPQYVFFLRGSLNPIDYYNASLTKASLTTSVPTSRGECIGLNLDTFLIIAGGQSSSTASNLVEYYDDSLTKMTATGLSIARHHFSTSSGERQFNPVGDYALVAGGYNGSTYYNTIDIYKIQE